MILYYFFITYHHYYYFILNRGIYCYNILILQMSILKLIYTYLIGYVFSFLLTMFDLDRKVNIRYSVKMYLTMRRILQLIFMTGISFLIKC